MFVAFFLEALVVCGFFGFMFTQVVRPLWNNTPLCPFFRRKHLYSALREVREEKENVEIEEEIATIKKSLYPKKDRGGVQDDIDEDDIDEIPPVNPPVGFYSNIIKKTTVKPATAKPATVKPKASRKNQ